ncbi:MAG: histidine ammonia-lyase [Defluviitaleaceae bacterium]|nr:histidine ammonia-lyase [Defluviitaleaceae bacterium]
MGNHDAHHEKIIISSDPNKELTLKELVSVARYYAKVELSKEAKEAIELSRKVVDHMVSQKRIVYGITTGFGSFSTTVIDSEEDIRKLQHNLIESHACGVGELLTEEVVRAMMLLRVKSLSFGHSGIRLSTVEKLVEMLNKNLTPLVPEKGSLGSSGDLCPLSHMALPLLGKGEAYFKGERLDGKTAMERANIDIIQLEAKEGLALNNGTQCMTAIGALTVYDALHLLEVAEMTAALTLEALNGRIDAFDPGIHTLRRHEGQQISAALMRKYTNSSTFLNNSISDSKKSIRVQDAYALRCIGQVHGASRDAVNYVKGAVEREMNAVTDNPLIFIEEGFENARAISGGNFHGQPVALAFDFLAIALAELANISERRIERMMNDSSSNGLPAYLTEGSEKGGLNSGFMIVQYTAASLVSENKVLAHPASVDSIPSSNNQEDHVSMGTIAARKAANILENVCQVIGMELLCAAQAVDLRRLQKDWRRECSDKPGWIGEEPSELGDTTSKLYNKVRNIVPAMMDDRVIAPDIADVAKLVKSEGLVGLYRNV